MTAWRILVVDDEPGITRLLKLNLEATGQYVVREEHNGLGGLRAVREFKPDAILLDVIMPHMDGGDVAALLQKEAHPHAPKIIFLTAAVTRAELKEHGGMLGGFPYIAKPVEISGVISVLEQQLKA